MREILLKTKKGFTIIETMIAVALFLVVVTIGMGALLNANLLHQKSQDLRSIIDNLSFIMDDMGRNLRTGHDYHCSSDFSNFAVPQSCALGANIFFEEGHNNAIPPVPTDQWGYKIDSTDGVNFNISKTVDGGSTWVQLNPGEVSLSTTSGFSVLGAEAKATDSQQPYISIRLVGKIIYKNIETPFSLQTSMSQRLIDI